MKTVALLFFAFVLVYTAPTQNDEYHILRNIINNVSKLLEDPEKLSGIMVPSGFDKSRCISTRPEDFCIAEEILSKINSTKYVIPENILNIGRLLIQYNQFHQTNCTVTLNKDEEQLRDLLKDLGCCAQFKYSRLNHKRAQRSADNNGENSLHCANQH
uniref:Interleukin-4 n=1 Tax=Esox lucius TaxID=8010 RepID=A0AAY5KN08_ESOLU